MNQDHPVPVISMNESFIIPPNSSTTKIVNIQGALVQVTFSLSGPSLKYPIKMSPSDLFSNVSVRQIKPSGGSRDFK